eukprot:scaffold58348_cov47-Attheya_sp.AAC.1
MEEQYVCNNLVVLQNRMVYIYYTNPSLNRGREYNTWDLILSRSIIFRGASFLKVTTPVQKHIQIR